MRNVLAAHFVVQVDDEGQVVGREVVLAEGLGEANTAVEVLNDLRRALDDAAVVGNCLMRAIHGAEERSDEAREGFTKQMEEGQEDAVEDRNAGAGTGREAEDDGQAAEG